MWVRFPCFDEKVVSAKFNSNTIVTGRLIPIISRCVLPVATEFRELFFWEMFPFPLVTLGSDPVSPTSDPAVEPDFGQEAQRSAQEVGPIPTSYGL